MIYFTSDLHFGHESVLKFCDRPFANLKEMERALIGRFNRIVKKEDTVYILGDFAYKIPAKEADKILQKLNGHKTLLIGNHDRNYDPALFDEICHYKHTHYNCYQLSLMHYPMMEWKNSRHGSLQLHGSPQLHEILQLQESLQLHGHIHSGDGKRRYYNLSGFKGDNYNQDCKDRGILRYDVGVDANNYEPVSIVQILDFFGLPDV